jgi:hypothetical protein
MDEKKTFGSLLQIKCLGERNLFSPLGRRGLNYLPLQERRGLSCFGGEGNLEI